MESLFLSLWNRSIAAGWLILAIVLLRLVLKKAPKSMRCLLWALVAVRLVCPFSIQSVLSLVPSAETIPQSALTDHSPHINSGLVFVNGPVNDYLGDHIYEGITRPVGYTRSVTLVCAAVWLAGLAVLCLWALVSWLRLRRQVAEAVPEGEGVWLCGEIDSPFLLGLFRPRIYLPAGLDGDSRAYVLAHERAHLQRRDHWVKPIGFLLLAVYWFNPLIWLAYMLLCRDIELACDERVVRELGAESKKPYSQALVQCSVRRSAIAACPLAFGEVGVNERVKNVLNYKKPAFWVVLVSLALCAVAAVCFLTDPKKEEPVPAPQPEGDFFTISNPLLSSIPPSWDDPDTVDSMAELFDGLTYKPAAGEGSDGFALALNLVVQGESRSLLVYPDGVGKLGDVEGWVAFNDPGLYGLLQQYYNQATDRTIYTGGQLLYELASLNYRPQDGSAYASVVEDGEHLFIRDSAGKELFTGELSRTKSYTRDEFLKCFDRMAQESGGLEEMVPEDVWTVAERFYRQSDQDETGVAIWELTFKGGETWLWLSEGTPPLRLYELIDREEAFPNHLLGMSGAYLWTYNPGYSLPIRLEGEFDFGAANIWGEPDRVQQPETVTYGPVIRWNPADYGDPPYNAVLRYSFQLADGTTVSDSLELRTVSKAQGLYGSRTYGAAIDWLGAASSRFHQVCLAADENGLVLTLRPVIKSGTVQVQGERTTPIETQDAPAEE